MPPPEPRRLILHVEVTDPAQADWIWTILAQGEPAHGLVVWGLVDRQALERARTEEDRGPERWQEGGVDE